MQVTLTEDAIQFLDKCRAAIESGGETATNEDIVEEALRSLLNLLETSIEWEAAMHTKAGKIS